MSRKERSAKKALCEAIERCFYRLWVDRPLEETFRAIPVAGERGLWKGETAYSQLALAPCGQLLFERKADAIAAAEAIEANPEFRESYPECTVDLEPPFAEWPR